VQIEIINTGTELLLGEILNTHQRWLCSELTALGYSVTRQLAVPDTGPDIVQAVREALSRADLVITTGGLGPTSDDLTRDLVATLLGRKLILNTEALANIEAFFNRRKRSRPAGVDVQAMVPEGSLVLQNGHGTAPGLLLEIAPDLFRAGAGSILVMLPGPPRELHPMFREQVVPWLRAHLPLSETFVCRKFKTTGIGESSVEARIAGPLRACGPGLDVGYCAKVGEVEVRLSARRADAARLVEEGEAVLHRELGLAVIGSADITLEGVVVRLLTTQQRTLALAESCTGGLIAHRLTNVPGASSAFMAGIVTYSNEAKQRLLGVRSETLEAHGAVSAETVREMADGARTRNGVDFALAVTGIAGPGGGTLAKPVGTVFIALSTAKETFVQQHYNDYDRETFKFLTSQQALDLLRRHLLGVNSH
jgi:nicotinamide-nucleotide amidase